MKKGGGENLSMLIVRKLLRLKACPKVGELEGMGDAVDVMKCQW